jgi:hypothetical protein
MSVSPRARKLTISHDPQVRSLQASLIDAQGATAAADARASALLDQLASQVTLSSALIGLL